MKTAEKHIYKHLINKHGFSYDIVHHGIPGHEDNGTPWRIHERLHEHTDDLDHDHKERA